MIRTKSSSLGIVVAALVATVTMLHPMAEAAAQSAALALTPPQPRGPFYPLAFPSESDADLASYAGRTARGSPIVVTGRVLRADGKVVSGATVEIWQTNSTGRYHHERDAPRVDWDPGFQGWGRVVTGPDGVYRFRTVRPAAYTGRTPHIHFLVTAPGGRPFYTQMYFADARENADDFLFSGMTDATRALLTVRLAPSPDGSAPLARFDIVLR